MYVNERVDIMDLVNVAWRQFVAVQPVVVVVVGRLLGGQTRVVGANCSR